MNMNKKTIITILLALVAILSVSIVLKGQGNETKSAETKPKYATEQKKTQDDAVLTYDISSLQDSASLIILVIREYNQLGMVSEMKGQRLNMAKNLSIGFSPRQSVQSDSMVTVYVRPDSRNGLARDLVLKPVPDAFCGEKELTEENIMESEYFKHSPHYYVIGAIFSDNTARAIPL